MLDIGGLELLLIAVVALLVIGPERLPETLRTLGLWLGRLRRSFTSVKAEIEKEIGMDEVKRQLHNEAVMEQMKRIEDEVKSSVDDAKIDVNNIMPPPGADTPASSDATSDENTPDENTSDEQESDQPQSETSLVDALPPEPPTPPTEAQLEAAYARKMKAQQAATKES